MTWTLEFQDSSLKQLQKLDRPIQKRILGFLYNRLLPIDDPRVLGKSLKGNLAGYWSYRVGDYRVVANIQDDCLVILVVDIDHRRQIYEI